MPSGADGVFATTWECNEKKINTKKISQSGQEREIKKSSAYPGMATFEAGRV